MTIYAKAPFKHVTEFNNSTIAELFATPEFAAAVNAIAGGGGLEGTNYLYVAADGTPVENATALRAAYTTAQGMSPSATNRITIIAGPGYYDLESTAFQLNTSYIDLVSLDGNRSVINASTDVVSGIFSVTANNVYVHGINGAGLNNCPFNIAGNLPNTIIKNCKGGPTSFGYQVTPVSSTFIDCEAGIQSFGGNSTSVVSGIFTNCTAGNESFGTTNGATASGTFRNCVAGTNSFGRTASGTFIDCTAGAYSFGTNPSFGSGSASGTFTRCTAGSYSFGYGITTTSGTFTDCVAGEDSFGFSSSVTGIFRRCRGGNQNFAAYSTLSSGTFIDCQGNTSSFAVSNDTTGAYYGCIGGGASFGAGGGFNGRAQYCVGGSTSFGGNGGAGLRGVLYWCRLTSGTFVTVSGSGKTRYCVDGNDAQNNQA
jgi:hypothetical protein